MRKSGIFLSANSSAIPTTISRKVRKSSGADWRKIWASSILYYQGFTSIYFRGQTKKIPPQREGKVKSDGLEKQIQNSLASCLLIPTYETG
jgi:hypothetical protein